MYLNGIKHNVVTNLNPLTRNVGTDGQGWADGRKDENYIPLDILHMPGV